MKLINTILKPFGIVIMTRKMAINYVTNDMLLLMLRKYVSDNWILFQGTILGKMIKGIE